MHNTSYLDRRLFVTLLYGGAISAALLSPLCVASGGNGPRLGKSHEKKGQKEELQIVARVDKRLYATRDSLTIDVAILNASEEPLFVYGSLDWGYSSSLRLQAFDKASQKQIEPRMWDDTVPQRPKHRSEFVKLMPGHYLGTIRTVSLEYLNIDRPGKYEIAVEYESPFSSEFGLGLPIWGNEKGPIHSSPIGIEVTDH